MPASVSDFGLTPLGASKRLLLVDFYNLVMYASDMDEVKDGILEGLVNAVISLVITYGIFMISSEPVGIEFAMVAVAATAFFTGYFTLTSGGVDYFSKEE